MVIQKYIPEGWIDAKPITPFDLQNAYKTGKIMNGIVTKCDQNYNLYIDLGNNLQGIIPRKEIDAINIDEQGFPKTSICTGKVNKIVQFKVKDISKNDIAILSRKDVGQEALKWIKEELHIRRNSMWNSKKYKTLWSIYRNRWRNSRITSYRRYISFKN